MTRSWNPATSIAKTLSSVHEKTGLSDEAFSELVRALDHPAMLNRSAAIEVLAITQAEDDRYGKAVQSIYSSLTTNDHQHTRSSAIAALTRLTLDRTLQPNVLDGLVRLATTDPYMTVRMDALELLAARDIDEATRTLLSTSLATEIVSPTHELWARSSGIREHNSLKDRAVTVLGNLHVPPYPDHVISAWIELTRTYEPQRSLEALRPVYERDELTARQIDELVQVAQRHRRAPERELVYAMLFVELQAGTLMDALIGFESADDEESRIRAGSLQTAGKLGCMGAVSSRDTALRKMDQGREPSRTANIRASGRA